MGACSGTLGDSRSSTDKINHLLRRCTTPPKSPTKLIFHNHFCFTKSFANYQILEWIFFTELLHSFCFCFIMRESHKQNNHFHFMGDFLPRQKRFSTFASLKWMEKACVTTDGAMRFSVCGSVWATHFF